MALYGGNFVARSASGAPPIHPPAKVADSTLHTRWAKPRFLLFYGMELFKPMMICWNSCLQDSNRRYIRRYIAPSRRNSSRHGRSGTPDFSPGIFAGLERVSKAFNLTTCCTATLGQTAALDDLPGPMV